MKLKLM